MKITETSLATFVEPEKSDINEIFTDFAKYYDNIKSKNIILDLSTIKIVNNENLSVFLNLIKNHKKNNKSFVLIVNEAELEHLKDEITAAPTFKEAEDLVEMEEIERDLGF